jgi:hypothetical protein
MPLPPIQSQDVFGSAQALQGGSPIPADGFSVAAVPSSTGLGTRTGSLRSEIGGTTTRKLVHWLVPEGPIVQMYCNPQQIVYNYSKNIEKQRTKGGFVIQYWGEELPVLDITGTTGTSGIEGINVLHDIYRNEQLAFDPFALFLAAKNNQDTFAGDIFGIGSALDSGDSFLGALAGASEEALPKAAKQGPTLASLATQVEMYWSGEVYRGYFNNFIVTERAENLGLFDYSMRFTVTQKRGFRRNFLAWHRSATNGPSNSNPNYGTPHTYGRTIDRSIIPPARIEKTTLTEGFKQIGDFLGI